MLAILAPGHVLGATLGDAARAVAVLRDWLDLGGKQVPANDCPSRSLVAASLASARALGLAGSFSQPADVVADVVAGHGVGQYAAAVLSGVLTEEAALTLASSGDAVDERLLASVSAADPTVRLLASSDGAVLSSGMEALHRLVEPGQNNGGGPGWLSTLARLGVTGVVELAPGGGLVDLLRQQLPEVEAIALKTPADLDAARHLAAAHREMVTFEATPAWRLVVAPAGGVFRPSVRLPGSVVEHGAQLGWVESRRDGLAVELAYRGVLLEWLAEDGDPVMPGQPLARLHPEPAADSHLELFDEPTDTPYPSPAGRSIPDQSWRREEVA